MNVQRFTGSDLSSVMLHVQRALGPEAMILRSGRARGGRVEVLATDPDEVEALRRQIEAEPAVLELREAHRVRPPIVAFVGSAGAGKTTTLMKLALNPRAYGGRRIGLLTLDTWGVGSVEEIRLFAEVAGFPLEVVHHPEDAEGAIHRLRDCDVILVDTPGRTSPGADGLPEWLHTLRAVDPDQVQWVCSAALRATVVRETHRRFEPCRPTHVLFTHMDEAGSDGAVLEVARAACLPARWVTGGPEVPGTLRPALPGLMDAVAAPDRLADLPAAPVLRKLG